MIKLFIFLFFTLFITNVNSQEINEFYDPSKYEQNKKLVESYIQAKKPSVYGCYKYNYYLKYSVNHESSFCSIFKDSNRLTKLSHYTTCSTRIWFTAGTRQYSSDGYYEFACYEANPNFNYNSSDYTYYLEPLPPKKFLMPYILGNNVVSYNDGCRYGFEPKISEFNTIYDSEPAPMKYRASINGQIVEVTNVVFKKSQCIPVACPLGTERDYNSTYYRWQCATICAPQEQRIYNNFPRCKLPECALGTKRKSNLPIRMEHDKPEIYGQYGYKLYYPCEELDYTYEIIQKIESLGFDSDSSKSILQRLDSFLTYIDNQLFDIQFNSNTSDTDSITVKPNFGDPDLSQLESNVPVNNFNILENIKSDLFQDTTHCPSDKTIVIWSNTFHFEYTPLCNALAILGGLVFSLSLILAVHIVLEDD